MQCIGPPLLDTPTHPPMGGHPTHTATHLREPWPLSEDCSSSWVNASWHILAPALPPHPLLLRCHSISVLTLVLPRVLDRLQVLSPFQPETVRQWSVTTGKMTGYRPPAPKSGKASSERTLDNMLNMYPPGAIVSVLRCSHAA